MAIENLFDQASSVMTVVSFATFIGIVWWAYVHHTETDFTQAAHTPFDDEPRRQNAEREVHHG